MQILDVSGKMLYSEAMAKQRFVTMMQATASHELRNPLASLIYKLQSLKSFVANSRKIDRRISNMIRTFGKKLKNDEMLV